MLIYLFKIQLPLTRTLITQTKNSCPVGFEFVTDDCIWNTGFIWVSMKLVFWYFSETSQRFTSIYYLMTVPTQNLTQISLASFCGTSANSANTDQTPQNAASDQVLHCLLTGVSFKI